MSQELQGLSQDARFELAMGAAGRARRNRPTALLIAAAAAMGVSGVLALWGFSTRQAEMRAFSREQADAVEVERLTAEWARLDRLEKEGADANAGRPITDLYTRLERLAERAGIKETIKTPHPNPSTRGAGTLTEYAYQDVKDPSLGALMEWMRLATGEVPGLELYSVVLRPEPTTWNLSVTFRRWEKTGS